VVEKLAAAATLEVEKEVETQLLPQTDDFGQSKVAQEDDENISDLSQNLLEDNNDESMPFYIHVSMIRIRNKKIWQLVCSNTILSILKN
jgi:hypothetical protein